MFGTKPCADLAIAGGWRANEVQHAVDVAQRWLRTGEAFTKPAAELGVRLIPQP
jgi:hypothetical protein